MQLSRKQKTISGFLGAFLKSKLDLKNFLFSILRRECLSLAVNVLTRSPKISHVSTRHIFLLNFPESDEKIW